VNCDDHYCLPPLEWFDLAEIKMLLAQKKYFVMHAPRQTGKTTCMLALVDCLKDDDLSENGLKILGEYGEHAALKVALTRFCQAGDLPVLLVLDEIDALVRDTFRAAAKRSSPAGTVPVQGSRPPVFAPGVSPADHQFRRQDRTRIRPGKAA